MKLRKGMTQKGMVVRGKGTNMNHYAKEMRAKGYAILWTSWGFSFWS